MATLKVPKRNHYEYIQKNKSIPLDIPEPSPASDLSMAFEIQNNNTAQAVVFWFCYRIRYSQKEPPTLRKRRN